jgi:hypothetical protein
MRKTFSLFAVFAIFSILIGSISISSMVFADEKSSIFNKEPTKHPKYDPESKYDKNIINHNSYQDFTDGDNIPFDSKRHHPRALEEMNSYKLEI